MNAWHFPLFVLLGYGILLFVNPQIVLLAIGNFISIMFRIVPVLGFVFVLLFLLNYFIEPRKLAKHLGKRSGPVAWTLTAIAGIVSTGPIYLWYPLLNELQKHGVRNAFIATFLYARAIKPALIPLLIYYFGLQFTIVLTFLMFIFSFFQGYLVEKIEVII